MTSTVQYEVVAVMRSGELQRFHSTDCDRAKAMYNEIRPEECLYKVLWRSIDHSPLDPTVIKAYPR